MQSCVYYCECLYACMRTYVYVQWCVYYSVYTVCIWTSVYTIVFLYVCVFVYMLHWHKEKLYRFTHINKFIHPWKEIIFPPSLSEWLGSLIVHGNEVKSEPSTRVITPWRNFGTVSRWWALMPRSKGTLHRVDQD